MDTLVSLSFNCTKETQRAATMSAPGSAPFTSPAAPGRRTARTPTATPRPGDAVPQPRADVPQPAVPPWEVFVTARSSLSEAIRAPDARQLGINVSPPSSLINLQTPGTPSSIGSDSEFLAIGALGGFSTASSFASSVPSTPARAGRHQDTSREYDGGMSRHPGAATNDAVVANPHDSWANVTVFPGDESPIPRRDDPAPLTADEEAELLELEAWAADTGIQSAAARGDLDSLLQRGEVNDQSVQDAAARGDLASLLQRGEVDDQSLRDAAARGDLDSLLQRGEVDDQSLRDAAARGDLDSLLDVDQESLADVAGVAANIGRVLATQDPTEMRAKLALMVRQDRGLQKLIDNKTIALDDLITDGAPNLQKLDRLRDLLRDEVSRASESYAKAATVKRAAPQPITGYNPTIPGYRKVQGTKFIIWQPARYADSVPS
jgi:hypothetical protein